MPAIFQYEFMVRALVGGMIAGGIAPVLGTFLVLRRVSLIADTLAHGALLGVAIGLATGIFPLLTTFVTVTVAAIAIELMRSRGRLPGDLALAVVLYTVLAGAVIVISWARGFNVDLLDFLFGSILSLTTADLWALAGLGALVAVAVTVFFVELAQTSFDDDLARVSGVPVDWVNLGLAVVTGATIALGMRILGVLLVGALIVVPVLAAQSLARSLRGAIAAAAIIGIASVVTGLIAAFYADLSASGAIVIAAVGFLVVAQAVRRLRTRRVR